MCEASPVSGDEPARSGPAPGTLSLRRALAWTTVSLTASAVLQVAFYRDGGHEALGDVPGRFLAWDLHAGAFPYLDRVVEYPVVIGYLSYALSVATGSATAFFLASSVIAAVLAFAMTSLLRVPAGPRLWRWVVGPPLVLFAFHNWDLLAMTPALLAVYAYSVRADRTAGAALAFGAWTKVFPGLLLVPLAVMRWTEGDRRGALRLIGWTALVTVVLNAPIALSDPAGWWVPARFQGARAATWGSLWSWAIRLPGVAGFVDRDPVGLANTLSAAALVAAILTITVLAVRRHLGPVAVAAAVTAAFLLTNKVYSPNYDLWIVPFFVLLPLTRRHWWTFCAADVAVFVLVYGWFHGFWSRTAVGHVLWLPVMVRAGALAWLIVVSMRPGVHDDAEARVRTWAAERLVALRRGRRSTGSGSRPAAADPTPEPAPSVGGGRDVSGV